MIKLAHDDVKGIIGILDGLCQEYHHLNDTDGGYYRCHFCHQYSDFLNDEKIAHKSDCEGMKIRSSLQEALKEKQ